MNNSAVEARGRHREVLCVSRQSMSTISGGPSHLTHLIFNLVTGVDKLVIMQVHADSKTHFVLIVQNKGILKRACRSARIRNPPR